MRQFTFLQREWPSVFESPDRAEAAVRADPFAAPFPIFSHVVIPGAGRGYRL